MLGHIVVITLKIKPERIMVKHSDEKLKKSGSTYCVFRSGIDSPKKVRRTRKEALQKKR